MQCFRDSVASDFKGRDAFLAPGAGGLAASEEAPFACVDVASPRLEVARLAID